MHVIVVCDVNFMRSKIVYFIQVDINSKRSTTGHERSE